MRILRFLGISLIALVAIGGVLYWYAGWRIVLDGSGRPRVGTTRSPEAAARAIEAHRDAQRAAETALAPAEAADRVSLEMGDARSGSPAETTETPDEAGVHREYWTGFRGPSRDGHYTERPILTEWPADGLQPLWRQPAGGGYASFAMARGRAFTIEQRRAQEVVAAYDVETGRELWTNSWDGEFREWMGGDGPRSTPAWSGGRVYALGALGELRCLLEATGDVCWRVNILEDSGAPNLQWGMAASPLVFDDVVVVMAGGSNGKSIVAYDKHTGARRWSALDDKAAYSSPMLVTLTGRRQILAVTASRLVALTPESGELLWDYPWTTDFDINASQPLQVADNRLLLSSAYGTGAAVIEITEGSGQFSTRTVWQNIRLKNRFSSSVIHEGFIYGLDENILTCLDAQTGEVKWKAGRYGHGQVLLASGHLVILTEDGDLALVRATPDRLDERVRFSLFNDKTWNHPALDDGRLLVRNLAEMAAFDLRVP